jgi:ribosomal protein L7/L12
MLIPPLLAGALVVMFLAWRVANHDSSPPRLGAGEARGAPTSEADLPGLIAAGREIEAIKLVRMLRGIGLKEAKAAIDTLKRTGRLPPSAASALPTVPDGHPAADAEVRRLVAAGALIEAIKRYRDLSGVGLAEAKAAVEQLCQRRS